MLGTVRRSRRCSFDIAELLCIHFRIYYVSLYCTVPCRNDVMIR